MRIAAMVITATLLCLASLPGQSHNRLRNAGSTVFEFFPESDAYRVIVRDVDQKTRALVEKRLPFKVHFNALGPHAMYLATRGRKPAGFVYLRSEEGQWGYTDIAWSLSMDMRILGFRFHTGRSRHRTSMEKSPFARSLIGKRLSDLTTMYQKRAASKGTRDQHDLADTVLRSAIKTLLVLDVVWGHEISKLQDLTIAYGAFPGAVRFRRRVANVSTEPGKQQQLRTARVMIAEGKGRVFLGSVARTESVHGDTSLHLIWKLTQDRKVLEVRPAEASPNRRLQESCGELEGQRLGASPAGASFLGAVAKELDELLTRLQKPRKD